MADGLTNFLKLFFFEKRFKDIQKEQERPESSEVIIFDRKGNT